jgi:hypothetical protein
LPVIDHWNGSSWSRFAAPDPIPTEPTQLLGVDGTSASDVWAVGETSSGADWHTLIEHFDGSRWSIVASPNAGASDNVLTAVDAISPGDAWAVGWQMTHGLFRALVLHWNGTAWKVVPTPHAGAGDNFLAGVSAVSADDVWAVGWATSGEDGAHTLVLHWDVTGWRLVPSPNPSSERNAFLAVVARSTRDVWAVGSQTGSSGALASLFERWDGRSWLVVPSPNAPGLGNFLSGAAASDGTVWAVGTRADSNGAYLSLVDRTC